MEMVGGCCVCLDERGWDENPLVYCDGHGCNVAVHQACYGIVKVPKGPWFCCKCRSTERVARVKCELCPFKEGALKRTDTGGWAHVVCALYIPEVRFGNVTTMEPILITSVPHERFQKMCYICEENGRESKTSCGACMTCNKPGCKLNFHVTCAQSKRMLCEEAGYCGNVQYVGYCAQHWTKKFGNKNQTSSHSDHKKSTKDKEKHQRVRHDSLSSSDGASSKSKNKKQTSSTSSKSALNSQTSTDVILQSPALLGKSNNNTVKTESQKLPAFKMENPEQSAAESLNLLQKMPNMIDYFPPEVKPKTLLNTSNPLMNSSNKLNLTGVMNQKPSNSVEVTEDLIDVESNRSPPPWFDVSKHGSAGNADNIKTSAPSSKPTSVPKKSGLSNPKPSVSNPKHNLPEGKKRKTPDHEKISKKPKIEDKKLKIKKKEKHSEITIPKPSKLHLYEDERIPPLFSPTIREHSAESFKDLLESQWDQGAHLLMQKATHFNVGCLLSCLHQLRAENEDLESRLNELSARRDRLVAATSRLSTPFDASAELSRSLPLSSMLSKLNSQPSESKRSSKDKKTVKSKLKEKESEEALLNKPQSSKKSKATNGLNSKSDNCDSQEDADGLSDSSLDGLGCKEVLSEDNSLNSSPKEIRTTKSTSKEQNRKSALIHSDETWNSNYAKNLHELVQPAISLPTNPAHLIGHGTCPQNPSEFLQQIIRTQQNHQNSSTYQNPPSMREMLTAQLTNGNNYTDLSSNVRDAGPDNHVTGSYRPVVGGTSNGKSPQT